MHVYLNTFFGTLLLTLFLSSPAQAVIMPNEHWDRCLRHMRVTDAELVAEMRHQTPPLVTQGNFYLDFSQAGKDCGIWIWRFMGINPSYYDFEHMEKLRLWKEKLFHHFRQGEIPGLDDYEVLRREACPHPDDPRMRLPYGHRVMVSRNTNGYEDLIVIHHYPSDDVESFMTASGDPRCDLLDEMEKQE